MELGSLDHVNILGSLDHAHTGRINGEMPSPVGPCSWVGMRGAAGVPGFLGKEAALFPESVLDGTDLLDVWLGEPRKNPDDFWGA